jgi:uncharacterized protein (TIGR02246 family)
MSSGKEKVMLLKFVLFSTVALVLLTGCGETTPAPATPSTEEETAKIDQLRNSFITAFNSGDAAAVADLYTSDGIALPQNQPAMTGREAILNYNKGMFEQFTPKISIMSEELKISGSGDMAFDRGTYTMELTPKAGGAVIMDEGKYLVVLQRQPDGSWKVLRDIDNSSRPLPPPPPAGKK